MNNKEIEEGINKICDTSVQFEEYFDDEATIVKALNNVEHEYLQERLEKYQKLIEQNNMPINELRVEVINFLLTGRRLTHGLLQGFVENSKQQHPDAHKSWPRFISIFHTLLDFRDSTSFFTAFINQLIEDLGLTNSVAKKIVSFDGSRNQATKSPWLGLHNEQTGHNKGYRLTVEFTGADIKCGLSKQGEWTEKHKLFNRGNFQYIVLLDFFKGLKKFITSDPHYSENARLQNTNNNDLNVILYGPPGTGKTYSTREKAVCIIYPEWCIEERSDQEIKLKYKDLVKEHGQIVFTTFHQSFSYEDFIQGISAELDEKGDLHYTVKSGIFKKLCEKADKDSDKKKYVLIIDEINRGNISKIFGELITLLEKDKRKGAEEELFVKLPYSNDEDNLFSVPKNVYVIGTMNTADKSLANIDLALRRRFDFEEMPPKYDLLINKEVEGINIGQLLKTINQRIEVLIDRDHLIGHSYMLGIDSVNGLKKVFEKNIIPLLQEYFYDDWKRIRWVLNDHRKDEDCQFIREGGEDGQNIVELFGDGEVIKGEVSDRRFYINQEAFGNIGSYKGILNNND